MFFERIIESYTASMSMKFISDVSRSRLALRVRIVEQYLVGIKHLKASGGNGA